MNKFKQLIKSTGVYFLGNVLAKVISFFMLPIYTRFISAEGMGYYDLANSYLNIIVPIVCLSIWAGALRFVIDYPNKKDKDKVIINSGLILLCGIVLLVIGGLLANLLFDIKYVNLIVLIGSVTMLHNYYSNVARALGFDKIFAVSGIIGSFLNCLTNLILITRFKMQEESLFISLIVGIVSQVIIMEMVIKVREICFTKGVLKYLDKQLIDKLLVYSAPLAMNSICYWFLSSYNRIGVSNILGLEANGIYSVAGKYAYVIGLFSNAFSLAVQELLYRTGSEKGDKSDTYSVLSTNYIKMLMLGLALLLPVIQVSFPFLIGEDYSDAYNLVPLNLLATVLSIYGVYVGDIFAAEKQTKHVITTTIPAAIVNMLLFHMLVPMLGIQAANISLLVGFLTLIVHRLIVLRKITIIKIDYKMLFSVSILFICSCVAYSLNNIWVSIFSFAICFVVTIFSFRDLIKGLLGK